MSLPPLRERREDIPLLVRHFLAKFATEMRRNVHDIAPNALDQLRAHPWPGNVRELEHVIQRAVALATGETITSFAFPPAVAAPGEGRHTAGISIVIGTTLDEATRQLVAATIEQCGGNKLQAARILGIPPRTMYRHFGDKGGGKVEG